MFFLVLLFFLSIVCIGAVFAGEMLFDKQGIHRCVGIDTERDESHLSNLFGDDSMIDGLVGILTPGKGTVVLDQDSRGMDGVDIVLLKTVDDDYAGVLLIRCHLVLGHSLGAGNAVVEVVCMRRADVGNILAGLGPGGGIGGVGVDDTA